MVILIWGCNLKGVKKRLQKKSAGIVPVSIQSSSKLPGDPTDDIFLDCFRNCLCTWMKPKIFSQFLLYNKKAGSNIIYHYNLFFAFIIYDYLILHTKMVVIIIGLPSYL